MWEGTVYPGVVHSLFNEHSIVQGPNGGREFTYLNCLPSSIWELIKLEEEAQRERKRKSYEVSALENLYSAKRSRGLHYNEWHVSLKKIAVKALHDRLPKDRLHDDSWRFEVHSTVEALKITTDDFRKLKSAHLTNWCSKFALRAATQAWNFDLGCEALEDRRKRSNKRAELVSAEVREGVVACIMEIIGNKLEVNCTLLRPFAQRFIASEFPEQHEKLFNPEDSRRKFTMCKTWLRDQMKKAKLSYRKVTNDAGKLPSSWEEDKATFLVRAACLVFKYNVPDYLFVNMDETPMSHIASSGRTWAATNSDNVGTHGAKDKRQATGTPWINLAGTILFFHTTVKGKTEKCLPKKSFRDRPDMQKIIFGYSDNHWVSKTTMRDQVRLVEDYRKKMIEERRLQADQKMIVLWDVYCRHRDTDLLDFIKSEYPNVIVLFVPANLTETCQPLDVCFNSEFKVKLASLRNERVALSYEEWRNNRISNENNLGMDKFKVDTSLSATKEAFYEDIAKAIDHMQTDEKKEKFRDIAFCDLKIAYNHAFQVDAVEKVTLDNSGKYFKTTTGSPVDNTIERFQKSMAYTAIDAHENLATMNEFEDSNDPTFFLGRLVKCFNDCFPGHVEKYSYKRDKNISRECRLMFNVKYYFEAIGQGRAKKVLHCTKQELLGLLMVREDGVQEIDESDDPNESHPAV